MSKTLVKYLMIDVFEFPHIPYWFTVRQGVEIVKKALMETEKCHHPLALLVFDEKYNLLGTVTHGDLLRGLEPGLAAGSTTEEDDVNQPWERLFSNESRNLAERPVSEIMNHVTSFVRTDDPASKAAYLMFSKNLVILPVLDSGNKLVGVVRYLELFNDISRTVIGG